MRKYLASKVKYINQSDFALPGQFQILGETAPPCGRMRDCTVQFMLYWTRKHPNQISRTHNLLNDTVLADLFLKAKSQVSHRYISILKNTGNISIRFKRKRYERLQETVVDRTLEGKTAHEIRPSQLRVSLSKKFHQKTVKRKKWQQNVRCCGPKWLSGDFDVCKLQKKTSKTPQGLKTLLVNAWAEEQSRFVSEWASRTYDVTLRVLHEVVSPRENINSMTTGL